MSFIPVAPFGGYSGWSFLKRTLTAQQTAFNASAEVKRDTAYFQQKIDSVKSADDLVSDRRLLKVALGAFGLDADINNKVFIRKVLADGTLDTGDLGNRLANKQYAALSSAFGFGDFAVPSTQISDFSKKIVAAYQDRQFEAALGTQNNDLRLALNTRRELTQLASKSSSDTTKWYTVMGNAPLRQVFEKALGLPASFGALDLDQQLATLRSKTETTFGDNSVGQFADPLRVEGLIRRFLARSEALASFSSSSGGAAALQLLQAATRR